MERLKKVPQFITIIGRAGAGVPVDRIEAIIEFESDNPICHQIYDNALNEGKFIKTLLDKDKIKSLVILNSGEIHPSTFHYTTLRDRALEYIPIVTFIGCDKAGINGNLVHLMIDYKFDTAKEVTSELIEKNAVKLMYSDEDRTKSLICMDSGCVYPSTFNYRTIKKRLSTL